MTKFFASLALSFSFAFAAFATPTAPAKKEVTISFSEVFIPSGLSSATDAHVIVSGLFPNSCYQWERADVVNLSEFVHEIQATATVTQGMCMMVMVPFQKDINLGRLPAGEHSLRFRNGDGTFFERALVIN